MERVDCSDSDLDLDAMREVGPGGHYFDTQHALERYENALYQPVLADWRNWEAWVQDWAADATHRSPRVYK